MRKLTILIFIMMLTLSCMVLTQEDEIPPEVEELEFNGVEANEDWVPSTQEFDGVEMVLVPAGCFMMGSTDEQIDYVVSLGGERDWFIAEQPAHEQCFDQPFWADKYEVTNAQFERLGEEAALNSNWTDDNRPRERVTWLEAHDFCKKRGARLPTEAEWEYAARGPDNLVYPWGNEFVADNVVYGGNSGNQTAEVGSKPGSSSWVGAYDLSGNVWEWTSTIFDTYPYDANSGRESNNDVNNLRVLRGGSWNNAVSFLRAANRGRSTPGDKNNYFGFRCLRSYEES